MKLPETKYDIGETRSVTADGVRCDFLIKAITIRINTPDDVRIVYEGTLFQDGVDRQNNIVKHGIERPWGEDESKIT